MDAIRCIGALTLKQNTYKSRNLVRADDFYTMHLFVHIDF